VGGWEGQARHTGGGDTSSTSSLSVLCHVSLGVSVLAVGGVVAEVRTGQNMKKWHSLREGRTMTRAAWVMGTGMAQMVVIRAVRDARQHDWSGHGKKLSKGDKLTSAMGRHAVPWHHCRGQRSRARGTGQDTKKKKAKGTHLLKPRTQKKEGGSATGQHTGGRGKRPIVGLGHSPIGDASGGMASGVGAAMMVVIQPVS